VTIGDSPASVADDLPVERRVSPEQASGVVSWIMDVPRSWVVAMIFVAIVSSVEVARPASGGISVHVGIGTAALAAIALIWLPAVLRLFALTGGGFKAFGFEASAGGLANAPELLIVLLANIRTQVAEVERAAPETASRSESVRTEVDLIASAYLGGTATLTSDALSALARRYEFTRGNQPPSQGRSMAMNQILNEARVRARASPEMASRLGRRLLTSAADGDRVIGLALLQQEPTADALTAILRLIEASISAFEQYHAVVALKAVAPLLSSEQRAVAISTLGRERADPRGKGLTQDPYIPEAISSALAALGFGIG
jgi:hypothetical protein